MLREMKRRDYLPYVVIVYYHSLMEPVIDYFDSRDNAEAFIDNVRKDTTDIILVIFLDTIISYEPT